MSINSRLKRLEETAQAQMLGNDSRPCQCDFKQPYFIVNGGAPQGMQNNKRRCPKCKGLYPTVYIDEQDLRA